jgi:hypothetical protein
MTHVIYPYRRPRMNEMDITTGPDRSLHVPKSCVSRNVVAEWPAPRVLCQAEIPKSKVLILKYNATNICAYMARRLS